MQKDVFIHEYTYIHSNIDTTMFNTIQYSPIQY